MEKNREIKEKKKIEKGKIFVRIMAGILVCLMLFSTIMSLVYALI